ncbi:MAG: NAD(+)/NADH kinase [Dehalococcoidales bacterium]|nr:NAD(+)/NADH kinase [Dehalococcoidales bacterium]
MSKVGIIANPFASMDIRRLVAHATTMGSYQKIGILRRVILALDWAGVGEILIMPDRDHLGNRALADIGQHKLKCRASILKIPVTNEAEDSAKASQLMREQGVDCIVTMGGDGTNRVVARACGQVPLMPISTGTNNTFPFMVEGTTAGLAAGIIARGLVSPERCTARTKKLNIYKNGRVADIALIDAVVLDQQFIGARAIWDISPVREVFATQCHPSYVGMASIGGSFHPISAADDQGLYLRIGKDNLKVSAAIAPGVIREVGIEEYRVLSLDERVGVSVSRLAIIALDGEREIEIRPQDKVEVELRRDGPRVVKIKETLEEAAQNGFFISSQAS